MLKPNIKKTDNSIKQYVIYFDVFSKKNNSFFQSQSENRKKAHYDSLFSRKSMGPANTPTHIYLTSQFTIPHTINNNKNSKIFLSNHWSVYISNRINLPLISV